MPRPWTPPWPLLDIRAVSCFDSDGGTTASRGEIKKSRENILTIHGRPAPLGIPPQRVSENSIAASGLNNVIDGGRGGDTGAWMLCEWQRGAVKVVDSRAYASYGDVGGEC
jgi:hypothetical protein